MKNARLLFCSYIALAMSSTPTWAQDAGLYDNLIDPSKAYVRLMADDSADAILDGSPVGILAHNVSGYVAVTPGTLTIGPEEAAHSVEAGTYYTFVNGPAGTVQFVDAPVQDPSKAELLFYNLTDQDVDLFVPQARTNAMAGVAAGTSQSVELRAPLTLSFEARSGDATLAALEDVDLERKQATSLFLISGPAGLSLVEVINSFADPS